MEWRDSGVLLTTRRHGEGSAIIDVFTEAHGRHGGIVRGGASRKMAPLLQPGAQLDVAWRARLEEHLGSYTVELDKSRAGLFLDDRTALAGLNAVTALLAFALPERAPHNALYRKTIGVLDLLDQAEIWPLAYLRWEMSLLDELGFGLDLSSCAATGQTHDLIYVSPKTGRSISRQGAGDWAPRLLPLPPVMLRQGEAGDAEIVQSLETTGYFLAEHLAPQLGNKPLPEARERLLSALARKLR